MTGVQASGIALLAKMSQGIALPGLDSWTLRAIDISPYKRFDEWNANLTFVTQKGRQCRVWQIPLLLPEAWDPETDSIDSVFINVWARILEWWEGADGPDLPGDRPVRIRH